MNNYNPIISSFYVSNNQGSACAILAREDEKNSIPLSIYILGFPLKEPIKSTLHLTMSTSTMPIYDTYEELDINTTTIPKENFIDDNYFGASLVLNTAAVTLPENDYLTINIELIHNKQILSTKETTVFVK